MTPYCVVCDIESLRVKEKKEASGLGLANICLRRLEVALEPNHFKAFGKLKEML